MFQQDDFDKLTYPVHKKPITEIARLRSIPCINSVTEREVAYLVYMYDLNSPFWQVEDIQMRKEFAAKEAGYDIEKDDLSELFTLVSKDVQEVLVAILRDQKSMEYSAMVLLEQLFYEYTKQIADPLISSDQDVLLKALAVKGKLREQLGQIIEQYKAYRNSVFGTNPEQIVLTIADSFTPEKIAKESRR